MQLSQQWNNVLRRFLRFLCFPAFFLVRRGWKVFTKGWLIICGYQHWNLCAFSMSKMTHLDMHRLSVPHQRLSSVLSQKINRKLHLTTQCDLKCLKLKGMKKYQFVKKDLSIKTLAVQCERLLSGHLNAERSAKKKQLSWGVKSSLFSSAFLKLCWCPLGTS